MNTQTQAFVRIQPTARETRSKVLCFAERCGARGFCVDELVETWRCSVNHVAPRCTELLKSGLVPTDRTRFTRAGHAARVLVVPKFSASEDRPVPAVPQSLFPGLEGVHRDDG